MAKTILSMKAKGIDRVRRTYFRLPKSVQKAVMDNLSDFMKKVQKSAKLRARMGRKFSVGKMAEEINFRKYGKNSLILDTGDAYYAHAQEFGFAPHWIPFQWIYSHMLSGGNTKPGEFVDNPQWIRVSKHKPFIRPALNKYISKLPNTSKKAAREIVSNAVKK
ncbi:MAG: hypothetical protein ACOC80_16655 [Petrotogales bacterium]